MKNVNNNILRGVGVLLAALAMIVLTACQDEEKAKIGLITKQEINPYWITMREIASEAANDSDLSLITKTGTSDVDVESQVAAIEDMVAEGVKGILIAPTHSSDLLPAISAAREKGVIVIALDTPVQPVDAVDAYFATDNEAAGKLIGQYAVVKATQLRLQPKIAMLDLAPGISTGEARHAGFLEGFGITEDDPAIVARVDTEGSRALATARMAQILADHPDVNVVYAVNEPAALGALEALKAARINLRRTVLVSVDGGCQAIKSAVRQGEIDATAMQFPQNMAREGVYALAKSIRTGEMPSGYLDTGVRLITDDAAPGVPSADVAYGVRNCWGD
jgi:fructose transport system substrate-binding protein